MVAGLVAAAVALGVIVLVALGAACGYTHDERSEDEEFGTDQP